MGNTSSLNTSLFASSHSQQQIPWSQEFHLLDKEPLNSTYILHHLPSSTTFKVKHLTLNKLQHSELFRQIELRSLNPSPFVVPLQKIQQYTVKNYCSEHEEVFLMFKHVQNTLKEQILNRKFKKERFSELQVKVLLQSGVKALCYLNEIGCAPKGLNTSEILISGERAVIMNDPLLSLGSVLSELKQRQSSGQKSERKQIFSIPQQDYPSPEKLLYQNDLIEEYNQWFSELFTFGVIVLQTIFLESLSQILYDRGQKKIYFHKLKQKIQQISSGTQLQPSFRPQILEQIKQDLRRLLSHEPRIRQSVNLKYKKTHSHSLFLNSSSILPNSSYPSEQVVRNEAKFKYSERQGEYNKGLVENEWQSVFSKYSQANLYTNGSGNETKIAEHKEKDGNKMKLEIFENAEFKMRQTNKFRVVSSTLAPKNQNNQQISSGGPESSGSFSATIHHLGKRAFHENESKQTFPNYNQLDAHRTYKPQHINSSFSYALPTQNYSNLHTVPTSLTKNQTSVTFLIPTEVPPTYLPPSNLGQNHNFSSNFPTFDYKNFITNKNQVTVNKITSEQHNTPIINQSESKTYTTFKPYSQNFRSYLTSDDTSTQTKNQPHKTFINFQQWKKMQASSIQPPSSPNKIPYSKDLNNFAFKQVGSINCDQSNFLVDKESFVIESYGTGIGKLPACRVQTPISTLNSSNMPNPSPKNSFEINHSRISNIRNQGKSFSSVDEELKELRKFGIYPELTGDKKPYSSYSSSEKVSVIDKIYDPEILNRHAGKSQENSPTKYAQTHAGRSSQSLPKPLQQKQKSIPSRNSSEPYLQTPERYPTKYKLNSTIREASCEESGVNHSNENNESYENQKIHPNTQLSNYHHPEQNIFMPQYSEKEKVQQLNGFPKIPEQRDEDKTASHRVILYADGSRYMGQTDAQGQSHIYGILYYADGQVAYDGEWMHGDFNGHGKLWNPYPIEMVGSYDFRDLSGMDEFLREYEGEFRRDEKVGRGVFRMQNGEYYEGEFGEDLAHGKGKFYCADGSVVEGVWERGRLKKVIQSVSRM